jgi:hypothetical protein
MDSSLWERFERLGHVRTMHPVPCGSPGVFVLTIAGDLSAVRTIDAMAALVRRGMVVIDAKRAIEAVVERRRAVVEVPMVEDAAALADDLAAAGFAAEASDAAPVPPRGAFDQGQAA